MHGSSPPEARSPEPGARRPEAEGTAVRSRLQASGSGLQTGTVVAAVVLALLIGGVAYRYWPSDERAIRRHLNSLAEAVSTPVEIENEAMYLTRQAAIAEYFAPDVQARVAEGSVALREPLLRAIEHAGRQRRVTVQLVDVLVKIADDRSSAQVELDARLATPGLPAGEAGPEVRHLDVALARIAGDWVITVVEERERPPRPRPQ